MDSLPGALQICVVGCGECGSRIAAYFDKMPSFLQHRTWRWYPVRCAAIDTDPSIQRQLPRPPWDWHQIEDIHILPLASPEVLFERVFSNSPQAGWNTLPTREKSGAGGFPFMGTLAAEEHLLKDTPLRNELQKTLIGRGFTQGSLLVVNSLSGGTGTGFGPTMPEFFASFFNQPRITLSLSIVPQITLFETKGQVYPANILYGLFKLSQSKRVDAVILADNDILSRYYGCKGNPNYNSLLHEILSNILLATIGEYGCPSFGKSLDIADIRRTLRPYRGLGLPELCTLSFAVKRPPNRWLLRLTGPVGKATHITRWLRSLVDSVVFKDRIQTTVGQVSTGVQGAIAVLSGPGYFFEDILGKQEQYFYTLEQYAKEKISSNLRLSFVQFPHTKHVRLSIILSGVTSEKLEKVYQEVVPPEVQRKDGTLMDRIRQLDPKMVDDLMVVEISEHLYKEILEPAGKP
ncbi:MAG: hypothetical protein V1894_00775 [Chloroflexota bacterium]